MGSHAQYKPGTRMILELRVNVILAQMSGATIESLYALPDTMLRPGSKLLDLSVDLGSAFAQECPPVSFYRFVLREPTWLRAIDVTPGQFCALDQRIALFSTDPDEPLDQAPARAVRTALAGIIHHAGMWTGAS
jgi:hypothetical protein